MRVASTSRSNRRSRCRTSPNEVLQQIGHADDAFSCFDDASRVNRLRSLMFGERFLVTRPSATVA